MTTDLLTAIICLCAVLSLLALVWLWRIDADAQIGRRLIKAAGSVAKAEQAITDTALARELSERVRNRRKSDKVRRIYPRITEGGLPLRETQDGGK